MSEFEQRFEALLNLTKMFPNEKRDPVILDSKDWDESIIPALTGWVAGLLRVSEGAKPDTAYMLVPMLRILSEAIYMLGYERGKHEQQDVSDDLSVFEF